MHPIKQALLDKKNYPQIMRELNVASSTISYHAKQLGLQQYTFTRKSFDWSEIQEFYNTHTAKAVSAKFGINASSIRDAIIRGVLIKPDTNDIDRIRALRETRLAEGIFIIQDSDIFIEDSQVSQAVLRHRVRKGDILPDGCANPKCTLHRQPTVWAGEPLVLHIDHENGKRTDNRVENLRWLCPNCHSQTSTYCGRNARKS